MMMKQRIVLLLTVCVLRWAATTSQIEYKESGLEKTRVSAVHRKRLDFAWAALADWSRQQKTSYGEWWKHPDSANQISTEFLDYIHDTGRHRIWAGRHAILAVQARYRFLKGKLKRAWDSLSSWQLEIPLNSRLPIPLVVLQAFFRVCLSWSMDVPELSCYLIPLAILSRLAFYAMLRVGDVEKLCVHDIYIQGLTDAFMPLVVALLGPKNKASMGSAQFGTCRDKSTADWLAWLVQALPNAARIWPAPKSRFNKWFKLVLDRLGLKRLRLRASSSRPGGTTYYFMMGATTGQLRNWGRWKTEQSCSVYIQEAMASLVWGRLSTADEMRLSQLARASAFAWEHPPKVSAAVLLSEHLAQWPLIQTKRPG